MANCGVCGKEMLTADGCLVGTVFCNGLAYPRMRYGEEGWGEPGERCPDCRAKYGFFHHWGCDVECCPACGGQIPGCDCEDVYVEPVYNRTHYPELFSKDDAKWTDSVGGVHEDGCGWAPNGDFCGECSNESCENCSVWKGEKYDIY